MVVGLHYQILLREVIKKMYSYRELNTNRFNELHRDSNELLARISASIRQSDKFLFNSGTLDISLGEHRFVKIRVHKGLNSCTTSVSKCHIRYVTEERNIINGILSQYMGSSGISRDSDLYKAFLEYTSMVEEMSVILGF